MINKRKITYNTLDFSHLADHKGKIKEEGEKGKFLDFTKEPRKSKNMKVIPITVLKDLKREEVEFGGWIENYRFIKICKNTGKSPGDLIRLVVTQTSVKYS